MAEILSPHTHKRSQKWRLKQCYAITDSIGWMRKLDLKLIKPYYVATRLTWIWNWFETSETNPPMVCQISSGWELVVVISPPMSQDLVFIQRWRFRFDISSCFLSIISKDKCHQNHRITAEVNWELWEY